MSATARTAVAFVCLVLYAALVVWLSQEYLNTFRLTKFSSWNLAIACTALAVPLLLYLLKPSKVFVAASVLVAVIVPLSFPVQTEATINTSQRVSFSFLLDHLSLFFQIFSPIDAVLGCLFLLILAVILTWTIRSFTGTVSRSVCAASLFLTLGALWTDAVWNHPNQNRFLNWDPMLGLFGYSSISLNRTSQSGSKLVARERAAFDSLKSTVPVSNSGQNIIVFVGDAFNPQHLNRFGYHRKTMPFIDKMVGTFPFAKSYIARTTCAESICGLMSFFGSRRFRDIPPFEMLGLGNVLNHNGYDVRLILVGDHRRYTFGSYGTFLEAQSTSMYDHTLSGSSINDDAIALEGLNDLPSYDSRPALIFVFFFSTHLLGKQYPEFEKYGPFLEKRYSWYRKKYPKGFPRNVQHELYNNYDNKLRQLDHFMWQSFRILQRKGYLDDAQLIVTGDHGEDTGRGNWLGHRELTEQSLKVPLIWASTKTLDLPEPENTTPRQIDIAPTILATQEIQIPEIWQGRKIQERSREELFFHEYGIASLRRGKDCQAVYGSLLGYQESKFHSCTADENGVQKREFFALDEDPFEQNNIWESLSAEEKGVLMQTLRSGARN